MECEIVKSRKDSMNHDTKCCQSQNMILLIMKHDIVDHKVWYLWSTKLKLRIMKQAALISSITKYSKSENISSCPIDSSVENDWSDWIEWLKWWIMQHHAFDHNMITLIKEQDTIIERNIMWTIQRIWRIRILKDLTMIVWSPTCLNHQVTSTYVLQSVIWYWRIDDQKLLVICDTMFLD